MPTSSERYQPIIEKRNRGSFTADQFSAALQRRELAGVLTNATEADSRAALQRLAEQAQLHGLDEGDIDHALSEIKEQLDIEANAVARHEYAKEKEATSFFNLPKQIGLRWQGMLETFGRGKIAERAVSKREERLQDRGHVEQVAQAAIERASLRKRYQDYIRIGGGEFSETLQEYSKGEISRLTLESNSDFLEGIENILNDLEIPNPFVIGQNPDGTPIEVPVNRETERMICNHLRFLLRDEVIQLSQLSQMKVMETGSYQVESKNVGTIAAKILGSGTLWGMATRSTGRLAFGGSIVAGTMAATPAGWGVIGAAVATGAVAGFASQVAEYKFARRQQKKMDLALGAITETVRVQLPDEDGILTEQTVDVTKNVKDITDELDYMAGTLGALLDQVEADSSKYEALRTEITRMYKVIMDTECRLVASRQGTDQQDYIAFGMENRLQAMLALTNNLKEAARVVRTAKEKYAARFDERETWDEELETQLRTIAYDSKATIEAVQKKLESALMKGEWTRRIFGAAVGGTFAGLSAAAMDYIHGWFGENKISPSQSPSFKDGAVVTVQQGNEAFTVQPDTSGDLVVTNTAGATEVVDLPAGVDPTKIYLADDLRMYDTTTGEAIGRLDIDPIAAVGETIKTPQLTPDLTVDHSNVVSVNGKSLGLVIDADGNLAVYNVKPDGTIDLAANPVAPPQQLLSQELQAKVDATANPAELTKQIVQLKVETKPDGTILVKSIYDQSTVAEFKVDASGAVSATEPTPITGGTTGSVLERLHADPNSETAQLLNKMGVQAGEIKTDPNGNFYIADDVVKGEYLGQTEGWRQVRLELMVKALQEGKLTNGEPADMVVARLERATRHMLLETAKYPDANAAMTEAFGRDANFIQQNELPWINGPKSVVSNDWEKLVDAMRKLPAGSSTPATPGTPGVPGTLPSPGGVHPISPDTIFNAPKPAGVDGNFAADAGMSTALNQAKMAGLDAALAIAGLTLEGTVRGTPTHLRGADQAITGDLNRRLSTYRFAEDLPRPAPVEPEGELEPVASGDDEEELGPPTIPPFRPHEVPPVPPSVPEPESIGGPDLADEDPTEVPEDPELIRLRLEESARSQEESDRRMAIKDRFAAIDEAIAERFDHQYISRGQGEVLGAVAHAMDAVGIFDHSHVVALSNHLAEITGPVQDRLVRASLVDEQGYIMWDAIDRAVANLKDNPAAYPFEHSEEDRGAIEDRLRRPDTEF